MSLERLYRIEAVAAYFGCSPRQVRRFVQEGLLQCSRIGRRPMFRQSDIDEFLENGGSGSFRKSVREERTRPHRIGPAESTTVRAAARGNGRKRALR